jgi:hypothetical protein
MLTRTSPDSTEVVQHMDDVRVCGKLVLGLLTGSQDAEELT